MLQLKKNERLSQVKDIMEFLKNGSVFMHQRSSRLVAGKDTVISVVFRISDIDGNILDESLEPVTFLFNGEDSLIPQIEGQLEGKTVGFEDVFHLEPEDAFGHFDEDLLRIEPRNRFPEPLEKGMMFEGLPLGSDVDFDDDENPDRRIYTITDLTDEVIVLDANHPLAGMAIRVQLRIVDIRDAELHEIEQNFADEEEGDDDFLDEDDFNPPTVTIH